jgi:methyl-accepting chemotaxis protein
MSSAVPLHERLSDMRLDDGGRQALLAAKPAMDLVLGSAVDASVDQLRSGEGRKLAAEDPALASLRSRQLAQWEAAVSGRFDDDYVRRATADGAACARAGIAPRSLIAARAQVLERLTEALMAKLGGGLLGPNRTQVSRTAKAVAALAKASLLDIDLMSDACAATIEIERRVQAEEAMAQAQGRIVTALGDALARLADGDVTARVRERLPEALSGLQRDFDAAAGQFQQALQGAVSTSDQIRMGADEISVAADDLSRRTEQQAASLEQTAAALDEITVTVRKTASGARQASDVVAGARGDAEKSGEVVRNAISAMSEIERSAREISQIIGVIDEIAFQTNLLALNAGVEAARAGDAGRGFAVVASEVRSLAQRSAEAAKEIKSLISTSSRQVENGVELVGQTGQALQRIVDRVAEIDGLVSEISASAQEQASGLHQVNAAINQMDQVTQQNAAMVEQSTAASHALAQEVEALSASLSRFHLGDRAPVMQRAPARAVAPPARPQVRYEPSRAAAAAPRPQMRTVGRGGAARAALPEADHDGWEEF